MIFVLKIIIGAMVMMASEAAMAGPNAWRADCTGAAWLEEPYRRAPNAAPVFDVLPGEARVVIDFENRFAAFRYSSERNYGSTHFEGGMFNVRKSGAIYSFDVFREGSSNYRDITGRISLEVGDRPRLGAVGVTYLDGSHPYEGDVTGYYFDLECTITH